MPKVTYPVALLLRSISLELAYSLWVVWLPFTVGRASAGTMIPHSLPIHGTKLVCKADGKNDWELRMHFKPQLRKECGMVKQPIGAPWQDPNASQMPAIPTVQ